jgi:hypothetical protein
MARKNETPEQRELRLAKSRERRKAKLAAETKEQKEVRRARQRKRRAEKLANETPEQREARLEKARIRQQLKFARMTDEQRASYNESQRRKREKRRNYLRSKLGEEKYREYLDDKNDKNYERKFHVRLWFERMRAADSCTRCGEEEPLVLQYHHYDRYGMIDPSNKKADEIGNMVGRGISIDEIKQELKKCICLCSNCHDLTHQEEDLKTRAEKIKMGRTFYIERFHPNGRIRLEFNEPRLDDDPSLA